MADNAHNLSPKSRQLFLLISQRQGIEFTLFEQSDVGQRADNHGAAGGGGDLGPNGQPAPPTVGPNTAFSPFFERTAFCKSAWSSTVTPVDTLV